jgi:O-antigen ligase
MGALPSSRPDPAGIPLRRIVDTAFRGPIALVWAVGLVLTLVEFQNVVPALVGMPPVELSFRMQWLPLFGVAAWIIARCFVLSTVMLRYVNLGMVATILWAVASFLWAHMPVFALTQSIWFVGCWLMAFAFVVTAWTPHRFENVMVVTITGILLLSLITSLVRPDIGIHSSAAYELNGAWRGITYQKNGLGQVASIGGILWTYRWVSQKTFSLIPLAGLALCLLMAVLARSSTAIMLSMISCLIVVVTVRPPIRVVGINTTPVIIVFLVMLPVLNQIAIGSSTGSGSLAGRIGGLFGKDATFSCRSLIWTEMFEEIKQHRWLGTGIGNFWGEPASGAMSDRLVEKLQWDVPSAHNGYLEVANELGLIGLGLFAVFFVIHGLQLARLARFDRPRFALHLALLVYIFLANITESGWFRPSSTTHVIAVYCSLEVSRLLLARRLAVARSEAPPSQPQSRALLLRPPGGLIR